MKSMRPFWMMVAFLLLSTAYLPAMPLHPDLLAQMSREPGRLEQEQIYEQELRARGINKPTILPQLREIMNNHNLDENFNILAILVDFSDKIASTPASYFDSLLYGNSTGKLRHYINEVTYGNLTLVTVNMPNALGWRRAPQTYDYYVDGQKGFGSYPHNAQRLAEDAISLANPAVNFSNYDNDGDGYVDALFIIHAGPGYEYTGNVNDIHSHAWSTSYPMYVDGVLAYGYSMEPEYWISGGDMTCGVYAHEMGHAAFGLPDLYDYGYDSEGVGYWSLMAGGSWNGTRGNSPAHPDAWCKIEMGVVTPTMLTSNLYGASIPAIENTPSIYRLWTNGTGGNQYFLVENRRRTGYDAALPSQGLLVYHIDDSQNGNDDQWYPPDHMTYGNYQVALEQADGLFDLEHNTDSGDSGDPFPGSTNRTTFDSTGTPSTRSYASSNTQVAVRNISSSAATMTADLIVSSVGMTVTSPNTAVVWYIGDANTITWNSVSFTENVDIHINRSYPGGVWEQIVSNTANDGSYSWTVAGTTTTTARIRVQGHTTTAVNDVSDVNFSVAQRSISVTSPNTAVTWYPGDSNNITWSSVGLTGNVNIEINRSYSGGTWETIVAGTANDGTHTWTVTTPATSAARIRITSVSYPAVSDVSNANFTIGERTITVTNPNTAVTWMVGESRTIQWTSANITGTVNIFINRNYSVGTWEYIVAGTTNDGSYAWTVASPITSAARIRIASVSYPTVSDVSDANFTIVNSNDPPAIDHDRLDDQNITPFDVVAYATDDAGGFVTRFHYKLVGATDYDSLTLTATANPNEYSVTTTLPEGRYEYFLRVTDAEGLYTSTELMNFEVGAFCGLEQAYDDGSAEASHWSENTGYEWAVKFDAGAGSYVLDHARIGVSAENPSADYSDLQVSLYMADGISGTPGTLVTTKSLGSLGNVAGGVPTNVENWIDVVFTDAAGDALVLTGDFYISISNPAGGDFDAFLHDENGTIAGRSFVYDPCDELWINETDAFHESARNGNRMIRAFGFLLTPPEIVASIIVGTDDIKLDWESIGAPYYQVYSSLNAEGPFETFEGVTATNSFIDEGAVTESELKFYQVLTVSN